MSAFKLYEISNMLADALAVADTMVDQDTGELPPDWAKFLDDVQGERDHKALDVACVIKSIEAEADALAVEAKALAHRKGVLDRKAESIRTWLAAWLQPGEKLRDTRAVIGWRKSTQVQVVDESVLPDAAWKIKREISNTQIKGIIYESGQCAGAVLVEKNNIQIR
jgi:hypothetical protein